MNNLGEIEEKNIDFAEIVYNLGEIEEKTVDFARIVLVD